MDHLMKPDIDKVQHYGTHFNGINLFWSLVLVLILWQVKGCVSNYNPIPSVKPGLEDSWFTPNHEYRPENTPELDKLRFREVSTNRGEAIALLAERSFVEVNPDRVSRYVPQAWQLKPGMKFYLVRCISLDNIGLTYRIVYDHSILWVDGGALTHRDAGNTVHTPLIVQLETPPLKVNLSISLAE